MDHRRFTLLDRRRRVRLLVVAGACLTVAAAAWLVIDRLRALHAPVSTTNAVLQAQVEGLEALVSGDSLHPLIPWSSALVAVDQQLVRDALTAITPYGRVVANRFHIQVRGAEARFEDGVALILLHGRATLLEDVHTHADIVVGGALQVLGLDRASGVLRARVRILGVEADSVQLLGVGAPMRRLVEDLGRTKLEELSVLASRLDIPVRVEKALTIPALDSPDGVRIAEASVPLAAEVEDVRAYAGKLWIALAVRVASAPSADSVVRAEVLASHVRAPTTTRAVARLRARRDVLRAALHTRLARDPVLTRMAADSAEVVLVLRETVVRQFLQEIARRYLDEVLLDLTPDVNVEGGGELDKGTIFGRVAVGKWDARLRITRLNGTLRASTPFVDVATANRVHVALPMTILRGRGTGDLRFHWNPHGVLSVVCHEFEATEQLAGVVTPARYVVRGDFVLTPVGERILAIPDVPRVRHLLHIDLTRDSWERLHRVLEEQDTFGRCGIAMSPDRVIAQLRTIGARGFHIQLPRSAYRTIALPAGITRSIVVEDQQVDLAVTSPSLTTSGGLVEYSARVYATPEGGARGSE